MENKRNRSPKTLGTAIVSSQNVTEAIARLTATFAKFPYQMLHNFLYEISRKIVGV